MQDLRVTDFLELRCLAGARLVAGRDGLERRVRMIYMIDHPEAARWLRGGELLITSGAWFATNPALASRFLRQGVKHGIAGLAIGVGSQGYFELAPPSLRIAGDRHGVPIIEFPWATFAVDIIQEGLEAIINRQVEQLEWAAAVQRRLTSVLLEDGGDLARLAEALSELIGNRATIVTTPEVRRGDAARIDRAPAPAIGVSQTGRIVCSVESAGAKYGYVSVDATLRPVNEMDRVAAEAAAVLAALHCVSEERVREVERRVQSSLFDDLINYDRDDATAGLTSRAELLSYPTGGSQVVFVLQLDDLVRRLAALGVDDVATEHEKHFFLDKLGRKLREAALPALWKVERLRGLVLVPAGTTDYLATIERALRSVLEQSSVFAGKLRVVAGVGRPFWRLAEAGRSLREAEQALAVGQMRRRKDWLIATFDELGYQRVLLSRVDNDDLDPYVEEQLGKLVSHDGRHASSLRQTLEVYLDQNGQAQAAADALGIHVNTLYHRLRRIRAITCADLSDSRTRFSLTLAFKILEVRPLATAHRASVALPDGMHSNRLDSESRVTIAKVGGRG